MIFPEMIIILTSITILMFSNFIYLRESFHSPIKEPILLFFGSSIITIGTFFLLIGSILLPDQNAIYGIESIKLGGVIFVLGESFISASFILPEFTIDYHSISLVILNFVLFVTLSLITYFTVNISPELTNIKIKQSFLTIFFQILCLIFIIVVFRRRYNQIKSILRKTTETEKNFSLRFYVIFIFLVFIFLVVSISRSISSSPIPNYGTNYLIPVSLLFIYSAFNFRNIRIWFVTSSELQGVIVSDKSSGLELFSKLFLKLENKDYITSFLKAMNVTTGQILNSNKSLEILAFADKVILAVEGNSTMTFVICSEWNLTTYSITKYLAKSFEKTFTRELDEYTRTKTLNKKDFLNFESIVNDVRKYIPL